MLPDFQLWWLMFLGPMIASLGVRLYPRIWQYWMMAVILSVAVALTLFYKKNFNLETAVLLTVGSIVVGVVLPAVGRAIEAALSRPRTYVWVAGLLAVWWVVKHPLEAAIYFNKAGGALLEFLKAAGAEQIAVVVLTIIIIWWGLKLAWRHLIRRRAS